MRIRLQEVVKKNEKDGVDSNGMIHKDSRSSVSSERDCRDEAK